MVAEKRCAFNSANYKFFNILGKYQMESKSKVAQAFKPYLDLEEVDRF
jgi:hypothetical protein